MKRSLARLGSLLCFGAMTLAAPASWVVGQDSPAAKAEKAGEEARAQEAERAAAAADEKAEAEKAAEIAIEERYKVPEGSVEDLVKFIDAVKSFEPGNAKEFFAHRQKAMPAIIAAASKIVEQEKDPMAPARVQATGYLILGRLTEIQKMSAADLEKLVADAAAHLEGRKPTQEDLQIAMTIAQALESKDAALAAKAFSTLGAALAATADDEQAKSVAETMQGAGRRLALVGQELQLTGSTHGGENFDVASLKGKVVLVDFWATWCGPCVAEYPNMLKNYEAYKDRGFEIVGISLDQNREALDEYLKEKDVPWITLHEKEADGRHPAATYYGVFGIPTMFLVGKDGKVVSTAARGQELDRLLADLLGPADASEAKKSEAKKSEDKPAAGEDAVKTEKPKAVKKAKKE